MFPGYIEEKDRNLFLICSKILSLLFNEALEIRAFECWRTHTQRANMRTWAIPVKGFIIDLNDIFSGGRPVTMASSLMLTSGWLTFSYSALAIRQCRLVRQTSRSQYTLIDIKNTIYSILYENENKEMEILDYCENIARGGLKKFLETIWNVINGCIVIGSMRISGQYTSVYPETKFCQQ